METNTIVMLCLLGLLVLLVSLSFCLERRQEERDIKNDRIDKIQNEVKRDLERIISFSDKHGDGFYKSLIEVVGKMEKLSKNDIKDDLRPYDVYNLGNLNDIFSRIGRVLGYIIINKNLEPRFMATALSSNQFAADTQLEVALTIDGVKELADKCRKIKMDTDIETFRKEKVEKVINNK